MKDRTGLWGHERVRLLANHGRTFRSGSNRDKVHKVLIRGKNYKGEMPVTAILHGDYASHLSDRNTRIVLRDLVKLVVIKCS